MGTKDENKGQTDRKVKQVGESMHPKVDYVFRKSTNIKAEKRECSLELLERIYKDLYKILKHEYKKPLDYRSHNWDRFKRIIRKIGFESLREFEEELNMKLYEKKYGKFNSKQGIRLGNIMESNGWRYQELKLVQEGTKV